MKIVDKYGLAECPGGTPFFVLNNRYYRNGEEHYGDGGTIAEPMRIKIGDTFYSLDNKPLFNGVAYIEIDNYDSDGWDQDFTKIRFLIKPDCSQWMKILMILMITIDF